MPTKAEVLAEIKAQLNDPTVSAEVKAYLQKIISQNEFDDKATRIAKAWAALKSRKLNAKRTLLALQILRSR